MAKLLFILLFICFPSYIFCQKKYEKQWNKITVEIQTKLLNNSEFEVNSRNCKTVFKTDSLNFSQIEITDFSFLEYFTNIKYLDLSSSNFNSFPAGFTKENLSYVNISETEISLTKVIEFRTEYKRGQELINYEDSFLTIEFDKHPEEIEVTNQHYFWWQHLTLEQKIILENNSNIFIQDLNNIKKTELKTIINLPIVKINDEDLTEIDFIKELKNLVILDCSNNKIEDLKPISDLTNLGVLICKNNNIENIDALENLKNLEVVIISKNQIENVDVFQNLNNIEYLDISKNKITNIQSIKANSNLKFLNLAYNFIEDFNFITCFKNLENLFCSNLNNEQISGILKQNPDLKINNLDNGKSALYLTLFSSVVSTLVFSLNFF